MQVKKKGFHKKKRIIVIFNTDATVLAKSSGCDTKHTEITYTIIIPRDECDPDEWNEIEACVRSAFDAATHMILPVGDNAKNMRFNFWEPYEPKILNLMQNGLRIGDDVIDVEVMFRADLAGHYGLLDFGGVSDIL